MYLMQKPLNRTLLAMIGLTGLISISVLAQPKSDDRKKDTKSEPPERPRCVVMDDDPISFRVSINTDDGPVYFCCDRCIKKYKASPAKYAENVKKQRAALEKYPHVQVTCPLTHEPISSKNFIEE